MHNRFLVRLLGTALLALACWVPTPAAATNPEFCARQARQIAHYSAMAERARERGNELWETRMEAQVERLENRARSRCPELFSDDASAAFVNLLRLAGQAAITYFTLGLL